MCKVISYETPPAEVVEWFNNLIPEDQNHILTTMKRAEKYPGETAPRYVIRRHVYHCLKHLLKPPAKPEPEIF